MPAPFFTTNDSEISRLEGLYIKERTPPAAISGVFLGGTGVVGDAIRGPVDVPVEISSEGRFNEVYGGRDQGSGGAAVSSLWKALLNKPFGLLVVTRAAAAGATGATLTLTGALAATGTIQDVSKANHVDAETVTLNDGANAAVIFEYDVTGNGVTGGHIAVNVVSAVSADDCANALVSAINSQPNTTLAITASKANNSGLINLVNDVAGTAGNQAITTTVANGGYTPSGMSGGTASGSAIARIDATSVGQWGNNVTLATALATDGNTQHFNLTATYLGKAYVYKNLDLSVANDNTLATLGTDYANVVKVTKLAAGVPAVVSGAALAGGSDGTIADSDFTASGRGLNALSNYPGIGAIFVAERSSSALKSYMTTLAGSSSDRFYLMGADSETVTLSAAVTEVASMRSDRIIYTYNHVYTLDPQVAVNVIQSPVPWMASILSQIDVDIHPGEEDTKQFTAGIAGLYQTNLQREDYISLRNAGIAALENDDGYAFVSGVTTSLTPGKDQITRRRMADYIQISLAKGLKFVVKKKNTATRLAATASHIDDFLGDLKQGERVVQNFSVDPNKLNTPAQTAQGIVRVLIRVKIIAHILELVLETEIGTAVNIQEAA